MQAENMTSSKEVAAKYKGFQDFEEDFMWCKANPLSYKECL